LEDANRGGAGVGRTMSAIEGERASHASILTSVEFWFEITNWSHVDSVNGESPLLTRLEHRRGL